MSTNHKATKTFQNKSAGLVKKVLSDAFNANWIMQSVNLQKPLKLATDVYTSM